MSWQPFGVRILLSFPLQPFVQVPPFFDVQILCSRKNVNRKPVKRSGPIVFIGYTELTVCRGMTSTYI